MVKEKSVNEEVEEDKDEMSRPLLPFAAARPEACERHARPHAKGQKRVLFAG